MHIFFRVGSEPGLNVAYDYGGIQARNNGVAAALNLNPLGGNVNVGANLYAKDITASRGDGTGVIFLNGANTRYVYFDGTQYQMPGANLYVNGSQAWTQATLTNLNQLTNGPGYITAAQAPVQSVFGRTGNVVMNSGDVTTALGYVPVNRAGDTMSAALGFTAPGTAATIGPGNGDGASSTTNNFALKSWYGIGFGPNITGQPVANGSYSHWFNVRTGDTGMAGTLTAAHILVNTSGTIGLANQTAYDIGAGRIAAGQSIYSYGTICVGNSSGDCTGTGGAILSASAMTIGGSNVLTAANISANVNGAMIASVRTDQNTDIGVAKMMRWKNYGSNHVLFDASASTAPEGQAISNKDAQVAWTGSYPTLMGWNGTNTYGVRVDSARLADTATTLIGNATIAEINNNGWYRSNGQAGWYSSTYGGGVWMVDTTWVRAYNGKGFLTDAWLYAGAGLQIAGNVAIDGSRNFNGGAVTASNYVQPGNIAGNGWGCAAAGSIGRDGSGNLYVCN
ncbi:shufflon system plasmid conjugative transfer pilus tip adhesin PilV [Undibacterium arcticum]